jgi:hypothetical protein
MLAVELLRAPSGVRLVAMQVGGLILEVKQEPRFDARIGDRDTDLHGDVPPM